jgi:cell division transport system permease protein
MALTLALIGAFGVFVVNAHSALERVGDELTVSAWLDPGVGAGERARLAADAARIDGVQAVLAVSPEMALARFSDRTGVSAGLDDLFESSPLPASLDVRLRAESRSPERVLRVREALAALPGVTDVSSGEDWVAGYARAMDLLRSVGLGVGGLLALATIGIVASTVRLALRERRDELEILSLVGAGRATLLAPFLVEGLAQGAAAGALALALLRILHAVARPIVDAASSFIAGAPGAVFLSPTQMVVLVACGAALGLLGAALSLAVDSRA